MYDIPELEKKWKKYKRNKIKKPIVVSTISIILLAGVGLIATTYLNKNSSDNSSVVKKSNKNTETTSQNSNSNTNLNSNNNQAVKENISKKSNEASIVIEKIDSKGNPLINTKPSSDNEEANIDLSKAVIIKPNVPDDEIRVIGFDNKNNNNSKSDILIPKSSTEEINKREEIANLEDKFKESQDPNDSLEVAKYYYKIKNYKKAETWAVNTNNLDGDIEESWLIFAKARAKQGKRVDAIKVLQTFYDETNSPKAKKLLDKLRKGLPF